MYECQKFTLVVLFLLCSFQDLTSEHAEQGEVAAQALADSTGNDTSS